jgi:hypothetical protein
LKVEISQAFTGSLMAPFTNALFLFPSELYNRNKNQFSLRELPIPSKQKKETKAHSSSTKLSGRKNRECET